MTVAGIRREGVWVVDDDFCLPDVAAGSAGVARVIEQDAVELDSTYHDTADLDLLRHGITLRHRTGATDPGWTLRVGDDPVRTTLDIAGGSGGVPSEAMRLLAGVRAGRPLQAVAHLHITRDSQRLTAAHGELVAAVHDDQVRTVPHRTHFPATTWREVEVALGPAGPGDLLASIGHRLTRSGAHPASPGSSLRRLLELVGGSAPPTPTTARESVTAAVTAERGTVLRSDVLLRAGIDTAEPAERAVRRLVDLLHVAAPAFHLGFAQAVAADLDWFGDILAEAWAPLAAARRMTDPAVLAVLDDVDPEGVAEAVSLVEAACRRRADDGAAVLQRTLRRPRHRRLVERLRELEADPPWTDLAAGGLDVVDSWRDAAFAAVHEALRRVDLDDAGVDALEMLATAVRRARLAAALADPTPTAHRGDEDVPEFRRVDGLTRLELETTADARLLRRLGELDLRPHVTFALGALYDAHRRTAAEARQRLLVLADGE